MKACRLTKELVNKGGGMEFIPDETTSDKITAPFIEDARADFAPFYSSNKTIRQAKSDVENKLAKLGAAILRIQPGTFTVDKSKRFGYIIAFLLGGHEGKIQVACLPIRKHTAKKEKQVKVQALLNAAQWLQTLITQQVFNPGANPLTPYLLIDGNKTMLEYMTEKQTDLMLTAPKVEVSSDTIVDAEIIIE